MGALEFALVVVVGIAALMLATDLWFRVTLTLDARRRLKAWQAIAEPLGLAAVLGDYYNVSIQGTVASRRFSVGYGTHDQLVMHLAMENPDAKLMILPRTPETTPPKFFRRGLPSRGELRSGIGDAEFDAHFVVWANDQGMACAMRLGPKARRGLLDYPTVQVHANQGGAWLEFDGPLETAAIPVAREVLSDVAGAFAEDPATAHGS